MVLLICGVFLSFIMNLDLAHSIDEVNQNPIVSNLICGLLHNLIIVAGVIHYLQTGSDVFWEIIRMISMGYLISDSLYFYISKRIKHSNIYLFHHTIFLIGWIYSYNLNFKEKDIFYSVLCAEFSSVTLNIRNLAKFYNYPKLDLLFSLLTYMLFWHFRVFNFTTLYPILIRMRQYFFITLLTPLTILQYFWFYLMSLKINKLIKVNIIHYNHRKQLDNQNH